MRPSFEQAILNGERYDKTHAGYKDGAPHISYGTLRRRLKDLGFVHPDVLSTPTVTPYQFPNEHEFILIGPNSAYLHGDVLRETLTMLHTAKQQTNTQ